MIQLDSDMKKKTVTVLAIAHSKRVCDPQPECIDRMEVRRLVIAAYRTGYNKAKSEDEEKLKTKYVHN